jgi:hypothetical protein
LEDQLYKGEFCLPSHVPELDGQPVDLHALCEAGVAILDYRGQRDPIAPAGSCIGSELWGANKSCCVTCEHELNRTIEKNIGHIFIVSKKLLTEFLDIVESFYRNSVAPPAPESS